MVGRRRILGSFLWPGLSLTKIGSYSFSMDPQFGSLRKSIRYQNPEQTELENLKSKDQMSIVSSSSSPKTIKLPIRLQRSQLRP